MTAGDDAGIFNNSDPDYQAQVGKAKSNQLFDFVRERLGAPLSSRAVGFNMTSTSRYGEVLTLTFETKFSKGQGTETIKWHKVGGRYQLIGYHVDSSAIKQSNVPQNLRGSN
jgi:hypothetical protein